MSVRHIAGTLRSVLFWIHLTVGVSAGLVILLMSVTGVLLGYERQLIAWLDGEPRVHMAGDVARLPLDTLLARAGVRQRDVARMILRVEQDHPVMVRLRDGRPTLALDPYTGASLVSPGGGKTQAFMTWLRGWHRWLGVAAESAARPTARAITGAANLGFLFLVLSGFYLWWPRRWTPIIVRSVTLFGTGLRGKARDFNWHNVIGFWSAIPLAIVVASAVFISYQWPERMLDRYLGSPEEQAAARTPAVERRRPAEPGRGGHDGGDARGPGDGTPGRGQSTVGGSHRVFRPNDLNLDELARRAESARPDWRSMTLTFPSARDTNFTVLLAAGNTYRPDQRVTVLVHPVTGAVREVRDYASLSTARKIRSWARFGHTGEVFGIAGQTLATLVSAGVVLMVWTGISLALRRFRSWWQRKAGAALVGET